MSRRGRRRGPERDQRAGDQGAAPGAPAGGAPGGGAGADKVSPRGAAHRRAPARAIVVAVVVLTIIAVAAGALRWWQARPLPQFPPLVAGANAGPVFDDFAGAAACAECHADEHGAWRLSTHGRAGGDVSERAPVHAFDGRPIRFADGVVIPSALDASARFTVRAEGRPEQVFDVLAVVGAAAMAGGGTQGYVTRHVDGTVRLLPWERTAGGEWFCNTGTRADRGWQPITPDMRLADCGDWPPRRVLGQHDQLGNCQECHGSQISAGGAGGTRWQSLAIDCESCHGPARAHVDAARAGRGGAIAGLAAMTKEESVRLCLRCHALKDALAPGYLAGADPAVHYSVGLSALSEDGLFPDGRTRSFAYQEGHLYSACYLNGGMTCVDCHAPHDQKYRSFQGVSLAGRFDDRQCTSCHASKAIDAAAHTRHAASSAGSRCVACHMPYLQQPDVGPAVKYARADHTISIPRPELDSQFGIRGACAGCHRDASTTQLAATIRTWYGAVKPLDPAVAPLVSPDDAGFAAGIEQAGRHPMAALTALGRALRQAAAAESPDVDARSIEDRTVDGRSAAGRSVDDRTLRAATDLVRSPDPDLAGAASAFLHFVRGDDRRTRRLLVDALAAHPRADQVRARWIAVLGLVADEQAAQGRTRSAVTTYEKALALEPRNTAVLRAIGYARLRLGDHAGAIAAFRAAVNHRPDDAQALVGLGVALTAAGNEAAASDAYRAALRANEFEPLAHFNLGNVALRAGRAADAAAYYERAVQLDAGLASAHFNLARARIALGQLAEAAVALRNGLDFEPANQAAADMLAQLKAAGH